MHGRPQCCPCAFSAPILDESGLGAGIVTGNYPLSGFASNPRISASAAPPLSPQSLEQMKGRRLIERKAGNTLWPRQCHVKGHATAVGVTNNMDLPPAPIDKIDGPYCLVG